MYAKASPIQYVSSQAVLLPVLLHHEHLSFSLPETKGYATEEMVNP